MAANGETAQSAGGYGIYTSAIPGQITISNALAEIQGKTDAVNKPPVVTNAALLGRKTQDGDLGRLLEASQVIGTWRQDRP